MTASPAITVTSISKTFKLYPSHRTRMLEMMLPFLPKMHQKYDALKNVSFSVNQGEVVGLIGQNGSGKSTILKILSSVVTPTSGSFECKGRLIPLLELGGGFDMQLTGIENIFFLGAIQGYNKKQMAERLKEILDFAEIGDYANQPVKNYSSGMYVRLAFSINININPDILIIDEALAVGDIRFQQKCFQRIREFKNAGKTIIFCSHSMAAIRDFCTRAIWLHNGKIVEDGNPQTVVEQYQVFMSQSEIVQNTNNGALQAPESAVLPPFLNNPPLNTFHWVDLSGIASFGTEEASIKFASFYNASLKKNVSILEGGETVKVLMIAQAETDISFPYIELKLNGNFGATILNINSFLNEKKIVLPVKSYSLISVDFKLPYLSNGMYSLSFSISKIESNQPIHIHTYQNAIFYEVFNPDARFNQATQLVVKNIEIQSVPIS